MNKEITHIIKDCPACITFQNKNTKETIINHIEPTRPWQIVAADLFSLNEVSYLLIVDVYSKYPELIDLERNTTSNNVILNCKSVFARHGKPEIFYSDKEPQFVSGELASFMKQWGIQHKTSTPTYAQPNGFIEQQIKTIKN